MPIPIPLRVSFPKVLPIRKRYRKQNTYRYRYLSFISPNSLGNSFRCRSIYLDMRQICSDLCSLPFMHETQDPALQQISVHICHAMYNSSAQLPPCEHPLLEISLMFSPEVEPPLSTIEGTEMQPEDLTLLGSAELW